MLCICHLFGTFQGIMLLCCLGKVTSHVDVHVSMFCAFVTVFFFSLLHCAVPAAVLSTMLAAMHMSGHEGHESCEVALRHPVKLCQ